jgi:hypothetical protein
MKAPLPVKTLLVQGSVDPDRDMISLANLTLDIDGPIFELSGEGDGFLRGRATDDGAPVLTATLKASGIDWKKLDGWWPETMAADSRSWLIKNITSGMVEDLDAKTKVRFPREELLRRCRGTEAARSRRMT